MLIRLMILIILTYLKCLGHYLYSCSGIIKKLRDMLIFTTIIIIHSMPPKIPECSFKYLSPVQFETC